jgi:hypothetical protein
MFREIEPLGGAAGATGVAAALRHPDGSINFEAYRERARRARRAAIVSSISGTIRIAGAALWSIGNALAGKTAPAARHHTP